MNIFDRLLTTLTERRGFHVSQEPPGWVESLGGYDTAVGKTVSPETALSVSAVFACVRVLAEDVASLPLILYERLGKRGKSRASDHPLYSILHDLPNPEMTSLELRETLMGHVTTWGNAYADIVFDRGGRVRELWPLRPDRMLVERVSGALRYTYRLSKPDAQGRMERILPAERVFHLRGLGFDGIQGYSPIKLHKQGIGLAMGTEEYGARLFGSGATPGGVLEHPGKLSEKAHERLSKSWDERHQGLEKAHRIAILEEGLKFRQIGLPPEDAQFLETRKYQVIDICRIYRVPPHKLAELDRATFSNIEHQSLEYVISTLGPWLVRWEQGIYRDLLTPMEREQYFAEHLVAGMLRGDIKSRYEAYSVGRQNGWLSANDVRELENMNPIEGGDVYLVPLNMIPADQVGSFGAVGDEGREIPRRASLARNDGRTVEQRSGMGRRRLQLAYFPMYQEVAGRVVRREINDVGAAARRMLGQQRDYGSFSVWLDDFYRDHLGFVVRNFAPLANSYGELVAGEAQVEVNEPQGMTDEVDQFIRTYVDSFAARYSMVSQARIREVVQAAIASGEDPVQALELTFEDWREKRPVETARWESVRFGCAVAKTVWLYAGVQRLMWRAFGKSCPYCKELDGQIVGINRFFLTAGTDFQPDGAERPLSVNHNVGHAPAHGGCDCSIVPA